VSRPDRYVALFGEFSYNPTKWRPSIPFEEQLKAFQELIDEGKVRFLLLVFLYEQNSNTNIFHGKTYNIAQLLSWSAGPTNIRKENPKWQVKEIMDLKNRPAVIAS